MARFEAVIGHDEDWEAALWGGHEDDPREAALSVAHEWAMEYIDDLPGEWSVVVYDNATFEHRRDLGADVAVRWDRRGTATASLTPCGEREIEVVVSEIAWEVPNVG